MPNAAKSSKDWPKPNNRFNPLIVAAASAEPPARPAETGISLSIVIVTPSLILNLSNIKSAALYARFLLSLGT